MTKIQHLKWLFELIDLLVLQEHCPHCEKSSDNRRVCIHSHFCVSSKMMDVCGEAESRLATELMQHEVQIERDILDPLNQLAEVKTKQLHLHTEVMRS